MSSSRRIMKIKYMNVWCNTVALLRTGVTAKNSFCIIHISYVRGVEARQNFARNVRLVASCETVAKWNFRFSKHTVYDDIKSARAQPVHKVKRTGMKAAEKQGETCIWRVAWFVWKLREQPSDSYLFRFHYCYIESKKEKEEWFIRRSRIYIRSNDR